jgi:hypothetical protein
MILQDRARCACPDCGAPFSAPEPDDRYFQHSSTGGGMHDFDMVCRFCGCEFAVDHDGNIVDDGDLDDTGSFGIGEEEQDVEIDGLEIHRCPRCFRRIESEPAISLRCPWCRTDFQTNGPPFNVYEADEDGDDWIGCPNCGSDGDIDGEPMTALGGGWIVCHRCGCAFHADEEDAWQEPRNKVLRVSVGGKGSRRLEQLPPQLYGVRKLTVRLTDGPHSASFDMDVPKVQMIGESSLDTRILHRLRFFGAKVTLQNLNLTGGACFNRCNVTLRDCTVSGGVEAIGCRVTMQRCHIENAGGFGVAAFQGTTLAMGEDSVRGCQDAGLLVDTGSIARLRGCRLSENQAEGIRIRPSNRLTLSRCEICDNLGAGVRIQEAQGVIRDSVIANNGRIGLEVGAHSRVFVLRSRLIGNSDGDIVKDRPALFAKRDCVVGRKRSSP